ncbi:RodZ domain-containing protein [Aquitalea sp. LB_tupeE]|uniref:RodZ domain-containing protein n=1 Tax=Aquitalea sp. LB_tupeE TaxID=2748078 RepID=UPI0015BD4B15|nr:RodZ domain-containing protein [Aquitalea sp. LB_tupeE]NWK76751.1 helix-turn-helix domain-containing protein [Aquitalea sp. LB_tupeE]
MEQEANDQPAGFEVGAALKAARERAGMSLGEVADRLKLSIRQLEAIEHDDFQQLPGATFVRGFVRNYARFLRVDPEPLMARLEQQFPSAVNEVVNLVKHDGQGDAVAQAAQASSLGSAHSAGGNAGKWLILVVLLAALAAAAVWLLSRPANKADDSKQSLQPMLTEQAASAATASAAASVALPQNEAASVPQVAPTATVQTAASAPAVVAQPAPVASKPQASVAAAADAAPAAATGKISLSAKQAAWISVIDATGKKLQFGTLEAGGSKELSGTPPFQLKIGNAAQVELSFNGQPVTLADKIRGTTAKIELK